MSCVRDHVDGIQAARDSAAQDSNVRYKKSQSTVSRELWSLLGEFEHHKGRGTIEEFRPQSTLLQVRAGRVAVDCTPIADARQLAADLQNLGMTGITVFGNMVGGWLPIEATRRLAEIDSLRFARAAIATTNR